MKHLPAAALALALALLCKPAHAQTVPLTSTLPAITIEYNDALMDGAVVIDEASLTCFHWNQDDAPWGWTLGTWAAFVDPFANTVTCISRGPGQYILAGGAHRHRAGGCAGRAAITVTAPTGYAAISGSPLEETAPPLSDVWTAAGLHRTGPILRCALNRLLSRVCADWSRMRRMPVLWSGTAASLPAVDVRCAY